MAKKTQPTPATPQKKPAAAQSSPPWLFPLAWFSSLRVGVVLLALLAAASIAGTLIPPSAPDKRDELQRAIALVYDTWWFKALLLLLAINIACTTWRTVIDKILPLGRPRFMRNPQFYQNTPLAGSMVFGETAEAAGEAFRRHGFRVATEGPYGYARRGMLGRWGAPVSHVGFIILLLGGFAAHWFAREGMVMLVEGEQTDKMENGQPLGFTVRCDDFDTAYFPRTKMPSHYTSTLTILENGHPARSGVVEVNRSVTAGGWTLHQSSFQGPLEGSARYRLALRMPEAATTTTIELSPGQQRELPGRAGFTVALAAGYPLSYQILDRGREIQRGNLSAVVSGGALSLVADQFEPDFVIGEDGVAGSKSPELNNPALHVQLAKAGKSIGAAWLFSRDDMKAMMPAQNGPYSLDLTGIEGQAPNWTFHLDVKETESGAPLGHYDMTLGREVAVGAAPTAPMGPTSPPGGAGWSVKLQETRPLYATIISLTRNPMIPLIYFGCGIMVAGLLLAFFIMRREVWIWVDGAHRRLHYGALYRHPRAELDGATRAALAELTKLNAQAEANDPGDQAAAC